jgi:hypothetical protein
MEIKMANDITTTAPPSFLTIINNAIENPAMTADVLHSLIDANERIMSKQAEIDFNQAMTRLQKVLPIIQQKSELKHGERVITKYAKYEEIDPIVRPLYTKEGFSLSYDTKPSGDTKTTYYCTLSHEGGHKKTIELTLPDDKGGAKSDVQAHISSMSYAKRHMMCAIFNIVTTGEDDDGDASGVKTVTEAQVTEMEELMVKVGADREKFLEHFKVTEIADLSNKDYTKAIALLKAKGKAK